MPSIGTSKAHKFGCDASAAKVGRHVGVNEVERCTAVAFDELILEDGRMRSFVEVKGEAQEMWLVDYGVWGRCVWGVGLHSLELGGRKGDI